MATKARVWTDAEKVDLYFQIIEKAGGIPWDKLKLPERRTLKAVQVMIDKEKQKAKRAREASGETEEVTPKGKRASGRDDVDDEEATSTKKIKAGGKKTAKKSAQALSEEKEEAEEVEDKAEQVEEMVKAEPGADGIFE